MTDRSDSASPSADGAAPRRPGIPRPALRRFASAALFAAVLLAAAGWIATAGLRWSVRFHPDEASIARWFRQVAESGYITDRAYPGGWYELHRLHGCPYARAPRPAADARPEEDAADAPPEEDAAPERKETKKPSRLLRRHLTQDGIVDTAIGSSFRPRDPDAVEGLFNRRIQDGRDFNAWLYALSALFVYLACLEAGMRPCAAFLSGLFFFAAAGPIEFVHYCETDMGLVVSLAFFAWISARAIRKASPTLAVVAGFSAGFAAACKFSLAPLALWCLALSAAVAVRLPGSRSRRAAFAAGLAVLSLLAAAAGFAEGTPALLLAPDWYLAALRHASDRTYAEILANLGGTYDRRGAIVLRTSQLAREFARMGALPLLWGAFAWSFWFRKAFRRQAAGAPALLPIFLPFAILGFPFIRSQELLPVPVLLALGAGLPLEWWLRRRRAAPPPSRALRVAAAACGVAGAIALADGAVRAAGMSSCFRGRDTRVEAQNFLLASVPRQTTVGFDRYVENVARSLPFDCRPMQAFPYRWLSIRDGEDLPRYYVENVGFEGRLPVRDLRTGRLRASTRENLEAWGRETFEIRRWRVAPGVQRPTFAQPDVRLCALRPRTEGAVDLPVCFPRPLSLLPHGAGLYDAEGAPGVGAIRARPVVGKRGAVHAVPTGPRWLVTRMLSGDGEARILCEAPFRPRSSVVRRDVPAVAEWRPALPGPLARFLGRAEAFPSARVRMRGDDQSQLCAAALASDPAEAAMLLRLGGSPERALDLLSRAERKAPLDAAAKVEAFLAASRLGVAPREEWSAAARDAAAAARAFAEGADDAPRTVRGVPLDVLRDFSLLRFGPAFVFPGQEFPVWLPPGRYTVALPLPLERTPDSVPPRIFEGQETDFEPVAFAPGRTELRAVLSIRSETFLRCGSEPFDALRTYPEIAWDPLEAALSVASALEPSRREGASSAP